MKKMPPPEKIHEALGAIADGRVRMEKNRALVDSSGGDRQYIVTWTDDAFSSNDSATYWRLYPGYPVIAVLLLQGRLPLRKDVAEHFSGINWAELNRKYKRKYDMAVAEVMRRLRENGVDVLAIEKYVADVYAALGDLSITVKRGALRPPK